MRVAVAMSGGVDSSVAAALLKRQGHEVVGVTMRFLDQDPAEAGGGRGCCGMLAVRDAARVAATLGFPHYPLDFRQDFERDIIEDFCSEYARGRTPNPCIACNTYIKWGEMLRYAEKLDCDYIATGHYARIIFDSGKYSLQRSKNKDKDQSYALWGIPYSTLSRTILPLGDLSKAEVRKIAGMSGFLNADRPESQEICFIPDNDYAAALKNWLTDESAAFKPGPVYNTAGEKLGEHKGFANYTVGQRKGLGISSRAPLYVVKICKEDNSVIVGGDEELLSKSFTVSSVNFLIDLRDISKNIAAKIRYKHRESPATVDFFGDGMTVTFKESQRAITPGQSAVFYSGDVVIGGGIIDKMGE